MQIVEYEVILLDNKARSNRQHCWVWKYERVGLLLEGHPQVEKAVFMVTDAQQHLATQTLPSYKISQAWATSGQSDLYAQRIALSLKASNRQR